MRRSSSCCIDVGCAAIPLARDRAEHLHPCAQARRVASWRDAEHCGERHLRLAISEFVEHYHRERNRQGLDNRLISTVAVATNENADPAAPVARRERLGGIFNYYYRRAV